jgi:hypothetical protein
MFVAIVIACPRRRRFPPLVVPSGRCATAAATEHLGDVSDSLDARRTDEHRIAKVSRRVSSTMALYFSARLVDKIVTILWRTIGGSSG